MDKYENHTDKRIRELQERMRKLGNKKIYQTEDKMRCPIVLITREPQECVEDKCYFWNENEKKCQWR